MTPSCSCPPVLLVDDVIFRTTESCVYQCNLLRTFLSNPPVLFPPDKPETRYKFGTMEAVSGLGMGAARFLARYGSFEIEFGLRVARSLRSEVFRVVLRTSADILSGVRRTGSSMRVMRGHEEHEEHEVKFCHKLIPSAAV